MFVLSIAVLALFLVLVPRLATGGEHRSYPVDHPVAGDVPGPDEIARLEEEVAPVLALSEEETRALLRPMTGFVEIRCPNCTGGIEGYQLTWSILQPDRCACQYCGHVYPSSQYPMDSSTVITDPTGEGQEYPYWAGPKGYPHYFGAKIDYEAQHDFAGSALALSRLYAATGERNHARRAAVILHRLAEIYPHFSVHGISDYSVRAPTFHPFEKPYPYLSGRWGAVWFYHEISQALFVAYTRLYDSGEFERLSRETGRDVRAQISEDLLLGMVDFSLNCPAGLNNMTPSLIGGLILAGKVLGTPDYVHMAVEMGRGLLSRHFFADGMWQEGALSYHMQTVGWLSRSLESAEGYSDPPGYVCADDGSRFDDLEILADLPMLEKARDVVHELVYPDDTQLSPHDTWAINHHAAYDPGRGSRLLWGMGQAVLRSGEGDAQSVLGLHFSGAHGHAHFDALDLTLYACGQELLPDLGYTHTPYRGFLISTAGHSTVVVDESSCSPGAEEIPWAGHLAIWEPEGRPARLVSVNCPETYKATRTYHRTCALVDRPDGGQYTLDVFHVEGGRQHDYHLKGDPRSEQTLESSVALQHRGHTLLGPGLAYVPSDTQSMASREDGRYNPYALLEDLESTTIEDRWQVALQSEDGAGLSATLMASGPMEACVVTYPTVRQAREDSRKIEDFRSRGIVLRRAGTDLSSTFVAVLEPFENGASSLRAEPVCVDGECVGAVVEGQGFSDRIVFMRERPSAPVALGNGLSTDACLTLVRSAGSDTTVQVVDGRAQIGGLEVDSGPAIEGEVTDTDREAGTLTVAGNLDPSDTSDRFLIVDHADGATSVLEIDSIQPSAKGTEILLKEPPDFDLTPSGTEFHFYPCREIEGRPRARIIPSRTVEAGNE